MTWQSQTHIAQQESYTAMIGSTVLRVTKETFDWVWEITGDKKVNGKSNNKADAFDDCVAAYFAII
jgi:hypothetical protein